MLIINNRSLIRTQPTNYHNHAANYNSQITNYYNKNTTCHDPLTFLLIGWRSGLGHRSGQSWLDWRWQRRWLWRGLWRLLGLGTFCHKLQGHAMVRASRIDLEALSFCKAKKEKVKVC